MSRHVLITGGAGFIGSHLVERLLDSGDRVTVLDNLDDFYDPAIKRRNLAAVSDLRNFRLVEGDIRDAQRVDQLFAHGEFDAVVHLAARAGVRPSLRQPMLYQEVNCGGTLRLLEAARRYGPKVFILGSSSSVYGLQTKAPFTETDPIEYPISPYATSKRAAELLAFNYHHLYGMRVTCLRFFTVYGPRQRPEMAIHSFAKLLARGEPLPLFGDGSSRRDYTFIDDILSGIVAALALAPPFEIINLGGAETTSLAELVRLLADALGVVPRIDRRTDQPGDVPLTHADILKARRLLGYRPEVGLGEGLQRFCHWYHDQQPLLRNPPPVVERGSSLATVLPLHQAVGQ